MSFIRAAGLRLQLGLVTTILLMFSFVVKNESLKGKMFVAAVCFGLLWWVVVGYHAITMRRRRMEKPIRGDVLDLDAAIGQNNDKNPLN